MMIPVGNGNAGGDVELYPQWRLLFRLDGRIEDGWLRVLMPRRTEDAGWSGDESFPRLMVESRRERLFGDEAIHDGEDVSGAGASLLRRRLCISSRHAKRHGYWWKAPTVLPSLR
jgi:hypothetical protein